MARQPAGDPGTPLATERRTDGDEASATTLERKPIQAPEGFEAWEAKTPGLTFAYRGAQDASPPELTLIRTWRTSHDAGVGTWLFTALLFVGGVLMVAQLTTLNAGLVSFGPLVVLALYKLLSVMLNRTVVTASRTSLTIEHGPLPWFGGRSLDAAAVTDVCVQRVEFKGGIYYGVAAWVSGRRWPVGVVLNLPTRETGERIARMLREALGLEAPPASGGPTRVADAAGGDVG